MEGKELLLQLEMDSQEILYSNDLLCCLGYKGSSNKPIKSVSMP